MITQAEIEKPRRPSELVEFVERAHEAVRADKSEVGRARLRQGTYKEYVEEVTPIAYFARWKYPKDDVLVSPRIGSQPFDGTVMDLCGETIGHIEVTWPIDGQKRIQHARELNEAGITQADVGDPLKFANALVKRVLEGAAKKAQKDYRETANTSLIIVLSVFPHFYFDMPDHRKLFDDMIAELRRMTFLAHSVYVLTEPERHIIVVKDGDKRDACGA